MNVYQGLSAKNVKSQKVICNFYMFHKGLIERTHNILLSGENRDLFVQMFLLHSNIPI